VSDFGGGDDSRFGGADISILVASALDEPGAGGFPFDRMRTTPSDTPPFAALGDVLDALPQGKFISAVLKAAAPLFAPRTAVVAGRLLPADGGGAAIGLTITEGSGRVRSSHILRERFLDPLPGGGEPADRWGRLVAPAAVWIRHELRPLAGWEFAGQSPDSWRGTALAEAGREWLAAGDLERAGTCYVRALDADHALLPVLNNLAVIELHLELYALASEHLWELHDRLESLIDADARWPGLREAALYNLVLSIVYTDS
jgi:tetratricopeptide (TPR) repeat protein